MSTFQFLKRAQAAGVPNPKRVTRKKQCYFCKEVGFSGDEKGYFCSKYNLIFGPGEQGLSAMVEMSCDDFKMV